jgi:imidazolonepropionase-like amidohydrolase
MQIAGIEMTTTAREWTRAELAAGVWSGLRTGLRAGLRTGLLVGLAMAALPGTTPAARAQTAVTAGVPGATADTAIEHVRLIDGTGRTPRTDVTVVVSGAVIRTIRAGTPPADALAPGTRIVDAHGETMMPGLINAHGHLALVNGAQNSADYYTGPHVLAELRQYAHYGVLDMLSLGLNRDLIYALRAQQSAGNLDGATVFVADRGIGVPGGAPAIAHAGDQLYQPKTPEEARQDVDAAAARHTNFIKVWVDDMHGKAPKMQPAIYTAVIEEAHQHHVPVAAHVYELADAKALVAAGVDMLAHSVRDQRVDAELIRMMKQKGTYYIPTLSLDESFFLYADHPELLNDPFVTQATTPAELAVLRSSAWRDKVESDPATLQHRKDLAMAMVNLKLLYAAGVRVGFGTDSGATPLRFPGFAEHRELQLMVQAGLTPMQAIRCATETNARLLGISQQSGTLAPGMRADFLLLQRDPLQQISNTERLLSIWHNGHTLTPSVPAAQLERLAAAALDPRVAAKTPAKYPAGHGSENSASRRN